MKAYPAEGGWKDGMSPYDTYHSWAATQYREKVRMKPDVIYAIVLILGSSSSMPNWPVNRGHHRRRQPVEHHRALLALPTDHPLPKGCGNLGHPLVTHPAEPVHPSNRHLPPPRIHPPAHSLIKKPRMRRTLRHSDRLTRHARRTSHLLREGGTKGLVILHHLLNILRMAYHLPPHLLSPTSRKIPSRL